MVTFGSGVGIGTAAAITAAVQVGFRQVLRAGRAVCYGAVTGTLVPTTAGLRFGTTTTRVAAASVSASGSAGLSLDRVWSSSRQGKPRGFCQSQSRLGLQTAATRSKKDK